MKTRLTKQEGGLEAAKRFFSHCIMVCQSHHMIYPTSRCGSTGFPDAKSYISTFESSGIMSRGLITGQCQGDGRGCAPPTGDYGRTSQKHPPPPRIGSLFPRFAPILCPDLLDFWPC